MGTTVGTPRHNHEELWVEMNSRVRIIVMVLILLGHKLIRPGNTKVAYR